MLYCGGADDTHAIPINTVLEEDATTLTHEFSPPADVVTTCGVLKASYIHVALYYPRDENHWPHSKLEIVWNTGCCLLKMSSYYSYAFRNANKCLIDQLISKMTSCIPNQLSWSIS